AVPAADHDPADRGEAAFHRVRDELRWRNDVFGPPRGQADVADRIERRPDVPALVLTWSVVSPRDPRLLEAIRQGWELKAGVDLGSRAVVIENCNPSRGLRVATPAVVVIRVVDRVAGLSADGVQVIRKARPGQRGKHVIGKREVTGVGE